MCAAGRHAECVVKATLSKAPCGCHDAGHLKPGEKTRVVQRRPL
jgi:hypothetical protein